MKGRTNASNGQMGVTRIPATDAVIHVQAQTGSEIAFSASGSVFKTLKAKESIPDKDNPYFSNYYLSLKQAQFGAISITATTGSGISETKSITIDSAEQYDVKMRLYLYKSGNENTVITGGLAGYPYKMSGAGSTAVTPTVTKGATSLTFSFSKSSASTATLFVENSLDMTPFIKMVMNVTAVSGGSADNYGLALTATKANNIVRVANVACGSTGNKQTDITSLSGNYYPLMNMGGASKLSLTFNEWWLE